MNLLDQVMLRRADEQVRAVSNVQRWERDRWAITGPAPKRPRPAARMCRITGCGRKARSHGWCHWHGRRAAAGLEVEWDPSNPGRRPSGRSL